MINLTVVGLGYVGLPTAALFASAGLKVVGVDINARITSAVNEGRAPIQEPGLDGLIARVVKEGNLKAVRAPAHSQAFLVAVGTPITASHEPDLRAVHAAARSIAAVLRPGNLVVLESTVPPGTTGGSFRAALEEGSGLVAGRDFALAHCAERAIPGLALKEMVDNDRLVGGVDAASAQRGAELYSQMVKGRVIETDALTSELVKLAENTYRDVNIAYANELARLCEHVGADVWKVVEFANRHPRVNVHQPGPGVGGHCIPVVPWFLTAAAPKETQLIRLARKVNDEQVQRVAQQALALATVEQPRITILGVAYKAGIDDTRESPSLGLLHALRAAGANVRTADPWVASFESPILPVEDAVLGADVIIIMTNEPAYTALDPAAVAKLVRSRAVLDTRNVLDHNAWRQAGFQTALLGRGVIESNLDPCALIAVSKTVHR